MIKQTCMLNITIVPLLCEKMSVLYVKSSVCVCYFNHPQKKHTRILFCWESLDPGIHVDATLTHTTYRNTGRCIP